MKPYLNLKRHFHSYYIVTETSFEVVSYCHRRLRKNEWNKVDIYWPYLWVTQYDRNGRISMDINSKIPTDGLLLRGFYNAITLAVYGTLSASTAEQLAAGIPAASTAGVITKQTL